MVRALRASSFAFRQAAGYFQTTGRQLDHLRGPGQEQTQTPIFDAPLALFVSAIAGADRLELFLIPGFEIAIGVAQQDAEVDIGAAEVAEEPKNVALLYVVADHLDRNAVVEAGIDQRGDFLDQERDGREFHVVPLADATDRARDDGPIMALAR